jgi:hypothetical protein
MKIRRESITKMVTSGYRDRWLSSSTVFIVECGDATTTGFKAKFDNEQEVIHFIMREANCDPEEAYRLVNESDRSKYFYYEYKTGTGGAARTAIAEISTIAEFLDLINPSIRLEIRQQIAETLEVNEKIFRAICWGLYLCNRENATWHVQGEVNDQVNIPGFELGANYPGDMRQHLQAIALAGQYYADCEKDNRIPNDENLKPWLWFSCPAPLRALTTAMINAGVK